MKNDMHLIKEVPGIDIVFGGHDHNYCIENVSCLPLSSSTGIYPHLMELSCCSIIIAGNSIKYIALLNPSMLVSLGTYEQYFCYKNSLY